MLSNVSYTETLLNLWFLTSLNVLLTSHTRNFHRPLRAILLEYERLYDISLLGDYRLLSYAISQSDTL